MVGRPQILGSRLRAATWVRVTFPPLTLRFSYCASGKAIEDYKDQTDVFYDSPVEYLRTRFPQSLDRTYPPSPHPSTRPGESRQVGNVHDWQHEWPEYLVMFGALLREPGVADLLLEKGYKLVWHENYGWEGDSRRRGGVVVVRA